MEHLVKTVGNEIIKPLFRRIGSIGATYLLAVGVPADTVETVVLGLIAGAGIAFDLTISHFFIRKIKK